MAQFGIKLEFAELEKLLKAQGEEFSILLSQNVLSQFADKYVKKIEHGEFAQDLQRSTQKAVEDVARQEGFIKGASYHRNNEYSLAPLYKEKMKAAVRDALDSTLRECVRNEVAKILNEETKQFINQTVEQQVQRMTTKEVERQVSARLDDIRKSI